MRRIAYKPAWDDDRKIALLLIFSCFITFFFVPFGVVRGKLPDPHFSKKREICTKGY